MENNLKKKTITSAAWKFAERIIAQGVSLIVAIVLARLLDPSDYGIVSIVTIFFTFGNVIIAGGLNTALIQKKDSDAQDYTIVLLLSVSISVIIYVVLFFSAPVIATLYKKTELISIFRVMGLVLPINAIKSVVCAYISSTLQFRKFFLATIGGTVASAIVGIYMALNGFGAWSLVAQQMTNTIIDTVILIIFTRVPLTKNVNLRRIGPLFSYGWKILLSSLIDTTYNEINPLFIGLRFSSADLSFYTKGKMFPSTISTITNNTLSSVLFPVLTKVQDDKDRLLNYVRQFIRISSFFVFPLMLGFFAVSDKFVSVVLTDKWQPASLYIKIFCFSSMFDMIASGNCHAIKAIGRSDIFLRMEIIKKISYFIILGVLIAFSNSPVVLALGIVGCTFISIIVNTFPNRYLIGYSYDKQIQDLGPNFLTSLLMCILVMLIGKIHLNSIVLLVIQIISGVIIYVFACSVSRNPTFKHVLGEAKNISQEVKKYE